MMRMRMRVVLFMRMLLMIVMMGFKLNHSIPDRDLAFTAEDFYNIGLIKKRRRQLLGGYCLM